MTRSQELIRRYGYVIATLSVVGATLLFVPLRYYVDFAHLAWLYLLVVGLVAWLAGTAPALLAAALSFGAGTYFTPPIGAFWVDKPIDFIQLMLFFAGAAGIGALTGQVRKREAKAVEMEGEATALARLASEMAEGRDIDAIVGSATGLLMAQPAVRSVVVWMAGDTGLAPRGPGAPSVQTGDRTVATRSFDRTVAVNLSDSARAHPGSDWSAFEIERKPRGLGTFIPLVSSSGTEGVLQVIGDAEDLDDRAASIAVSISHLLAVFIASERAIETASRVQGSQEAARVKAVIVSAVSHELKTPLAAAVAAVTDLAAEDVQRDPSQIKEALGGVIGNLERLQTAISDLLDLSRLQSAEWMPHPELYEAGEVFGDVVASVDREVRERLVFRIKERPVPEIYADFAQIARAFRAVLDNAVQYSPAGTPIFLGAERLDDATLMWIEDRGSGVSDTEKPFVFDRAYRGSAGVRRPGSTGLGLTIARDLIEANAGTLLAGDATPTGTRITARLPAGGPDEETA